MDVTSYHMDNVSFHFETIVQKWEYVPQRRIIVVRELVKGTLDCIEITKATRVMKIIINDGKTCEKVVKELRKVYDRGKCVKLSPSMIN